MQAAFARRSINTIALIAASLLNPVTVRACDGSALIGQCVTLSVTAEGSAPFSYQWYRNGSAVVGATSSTYQIASVQSTDAGTYTVVVSNSAGSATSDNARLTVACPPAIITQPSSQTVAAGASVSFSAAAVGEPAPTYQWQCNGSAIQGATNSSYTIACASVGNSGTYTVTATNAAGSITSNGAVLTVGAAPAFTIQPQSQSAKVGASVTFTAAASGSPAPAYQWLKNGNTVPGATSASYTISQASTNSAGTYAVIAANTAGTATSNSATLTIDSPPIFTLQPLSQKVKVGASVTFTAEASGSPAPTYQWLKNGNTIPGATGASYTIARVSTNSAGTYTVTAANIAGTATSNGATLTVDSPPVFTLQPLSQKVKVGASVTFTAAASGSPAPTYQWLKNGNAIPGATGASYSIAKASAGSAGIYTVTAANSAGTTTSNGATLVVTPTAPTVAADFDGDGRSDVVWQNTATGESFIWTRVGLNGRKSTSLGVTALDWHVAGTGDFDGDGETDLLWQNTTTGEYGVWLMHRMAEVTWISLGTVTPGWQIVGTGDFNGDGWADIIWQNPSTGECGIGLMNGTVQVDWVSLGVFSTDWIIVGTGDFDGDGQTDILWQNSATGEYGAWLMRGTTQSTWLHLGVAIPGRRIAGTGDFNGDGNPDILWQNTGPGAAGISVSGDGQQYGWLSLGQLSPNWQIRN